MSHRHRVALYQRRRQPNGWGMDTEEPAEPPERNANTGTGGGTSQGRHNVSNNPQTEGPTSTTSEELNGALQHLRHVQWEQPNSNAPSADLNPLAANAATDAAREALASFGEGASANMIHALATWFASHVRARHPTRAPNHWCWSITAVFWLIARAMRHNGADQGLGCRSMASRFGINAAGMRERPISAWEVEGTTCNYTFNPGTLPPGAQSLGENESVVSYNPRMSEDAAAHLEGLVQVIWTENSNEEVRNTIDEVNMQAPDIDMCDGEQAQTNADTASEGTAMAADREEEHDQQIPREPSGINGEERGTASQSPDNSNDVIANSRLPDSLLTQESPHQSVEITAGPQTQGTDEASSSLHEGTRTSVDAECRDAIAPSDGRTPNSGEVPQADENNSTFEHRLGHRTDDSVPCEQDNNFTGEGNHSACEIPNNTQSAGENNSCQPDQPGVQQPIADLLRRRGPDA